MATDNDVYQLTHTSLFDGVQVENVYFYQRGTGISAGAEELANEWYEQVWPTINDFRSDDITSQAISVDNLFDPADTFTIFHSIVGEYGNVEVLPPHDAVSFTLTRENATTRNGGKRMAGVPEGVQVDGIMNDSTWLTHMAELGAKFIAPILGTLAAEWFLPVIVGRIEESTGYRLPESASEAVVNAILDFSFNPDVSTQTSRKFGNGA